MRKAYNYSAVQDTNGGTQNKLVRVTIWVNDPDLDKKQWDLELTVCNGSHCTHMNLTQDQAKSLRNFLNNYLPK